MTDRRFGGFWRRFMAAIIDQIILKIIYVSFFFLGMAAGFTGFGIYDYAMPPDTFIRTAGGLALFYYGVCTVVNISYFTYFHGYTGQTPGKMVMNLKVMQASGAEMTPGLAFLRWVGYLVSLMFFGLGYFWVMIDPRKQGWHDKIAGSVVIRTKEKTKEKYLDKASDID